MARRLLIGVRKLACGVACVAAWVSASAQPVTDAQVQAGIERMRAWLYEQQDAATGSWDDPAWPELDRQSYHATAETALVTYALLVSGESRQDPRLAKAIEYLKANRVQSTYLAAMRAHLWALLPEESMPLLKQEANYLEKTERGGKFFYTPDSNFGSNSLTQYGVLGMWEHRKRGGKVDEDFWERVGEYILGDQNDDGGWRYDSTRPSLRGGQSTASMTAASLVVLQIVQQELERDQRRPNAELAAAIERGVAWLDERFDPAENSGYGNGNPFRYYYLYGIERIALAGGISRLNGRDWFEAGARFILEREDERGHIKRGRGLDDNSNRIDTAFALLFLSRGRVPLWAGKFEIPGQPTNARPNDLYFLTRFLSDQREAELNWQVVSIDSDPADWLRAPVLYLSIGQPLELTDTQQQKLKRYLDLGGMLVVNPEGRGNRVARSVVQLGQALYPRYEFANVTAEHPFASLIVDLSRGSGRLKPRVQTLSNGVRDLIVMPREDWGYVFQAEDAGRGDAWKYATNLYATATDRGQLSNRLDATRPARDAERETTATATVVRALHAGNADAEPAALETAGIDLFNRTGVDLDVRALPLEQIGEPVGEDGDGQPLFPALVHLTGTEAVAFTDEQLAAVKAYVAAGGTVLVETVGGFGEFADDAGAQLAGALDAERRWLDALDPIITGEGLDGAVDASRVEYRAFAQLQGAPGDRPNLAALYVGERSAVILSPRDLSVGAVGTRYFKVNGYAPDSARKLLGNVVLWAKQRGDAAR
ncbi:MAG: DUF4159 domain-containing protein [Planctomycetota bacterium]